MDSSSQATSHSSPAPGPLNISVAGDALALVHSCFGALPEDSLVLVGVREGVTGGHLRVDLTPLMRSPQAHMAQCAQWIAGPQAEPAPEAVVAMLFTAEQPCAVSEQKFGELVDSLTHSLWTQQQTALVRVWHIGGDPAQGRWVRDFWCEDLRCCPFPGLPAEHQLAAALRIHPELARRPPLSPTPGSAVREYLNPARSVPESDILRTQHMADVAEAPLKSEPLAALWDEALREVQRNGDSDRIHQEPERTAGLLASLRSTRGRDALIPLSALGFHATVAGMAFEDIRVAGTAAQQLDFAELELQDQLALLSLHLAGEVAPELTEQMLADYDACWSGSTGYAPNWGRIEALDRILRELLAYARGVERESVLNVKGWIEWARGRGSVAAAFHDQALREFPHSRLAGLLLRYEEAFGVCPWAQVKRQSHSWRSTAGGDAPK